jgi:hypothetical protein
MDYLNKVNNGATVSLDMKNWVMISTAAFFVTRIRTGMMRSREGKRTLICCTVGHAHLRSSERFRVVINRYLRADGMVGSRLPRYEQYIPLTESPSLL